MATQKQIDANRKNAQKSTGPRTQAGKDRARMNAIVHGLRATALTREEDAELKKSLREQLEREWQPGSTMEVMLIDHIVDTALKLRMIPEMEQRQIDGYRTRYGEASTPAILARDLASLRPLAGPILDYQNTLSRRLSRLVRDLRMLQQDRAKRDEDEDPAAVDTPGEDRAESEASEESTNPADAQPGTLASPESPGEGSAATTTALARSEQTNPIPPQPAASTTPALHRTSPDARQTEAPAYDPVGDHPATLQSFTNTASLPSLPKRP